MVEARRGRGAGLAVAALVLLAAGGAAAEGGQPAPRAKLALEHAFGAGAWAAAGTLELKVRPQAAPTAARPAARPTPRGWWAGRCGRTRNIPP